MTTFLLIRHASHDLLGKKLAGRAAGISLNARGIAEAEQLAARLAAAPISRVFSSSSERARQTAGPIAAALGQEVRVNAAIDEIDFGSWMGRAFPELENDPEWRVWNERRSAARPPGGELIGQVQRRVVGAMEQMAAAGESCVALVSHGDVIKAALAHFLALSLDELERFEISPASISVVALGAGWSQVRRINDTGGLFPA